MKMKINIEIDVDIIFENNKMLLINNNSIIKEIKSFKEWCELTKNANSGLSLEESKTMYSNMRSIGLM